MAESTQPGSVPRRGLQDSPRAKRILIADDDSDIRCILRRELEDCGWAVDEAENGLDAISKAGALKPELVILDLSMPVMNGYDAARTLNRKMPDVPLIMFTMYGGVMAKLPANILSLKAIISKSNGMTPLIECVQKILGA